MPNCQYYSGVRPITAFLYGEEGKQHKHKIRWRTPLTVLTVMATTESLELVVEEQKATETKHPQY